MAARKTARPSKRVKHLRAKPLSGKKAKGVKGGTGYVQYKWLHEVSY